MSEVMRPHWLKDEAIGLVLLAVLGIVVLVLITFCAVPLAGHLLALFLARMLGEAIGEHAKRNRLSVFLGFVVLVILPAPIQFLAVLKFSNFPVFLCIPSVILLGLCYWVGFMIGRNDEREEAKKYILSTIIQR